MSISRAWVGTRSLPESYFDTHANRTGYNNSVENQKLILLPLFFVLLRVCLGYIYHSVSPMLYQPRSINLTVHLICFSQSTRLALEKHLFSSSLSDTFLRFSDCQGLGLCWRNVPYNFEPNQRVRWDSASWKEDLWLPCNSCENHPCQFELLQGGRGFKGNR